MVWYGMVWYGMVWYGMGVVVQIFLTFFFNKKCVEKQKEGKNVNQ